MRIAISVIVVMTVILLTLEVGATIKRKIGCKLNGKVYKAGSVALKDDSLCLKLKCIEKMNRKGRRKFVLKPRRLKGCNCVTACPACLGVYAPVCGTNHVTYTNGCLLLASMIPCGHDNAEILHDGECGKCPTGDCPEAILPVCGSDNITYDNECALLKAACKASSDLGLSRKGSCEDAPIKPGSKCRYNGKKYEVWETIQILEKHCMKITCQPSSDGKKPSVTFQDISLVSGCGCYSKSHKEHH